MASIIDALEERLIQNFLEQETKKNWEEWLLWLENLDCPLSFEKPLNLPNRPFSFQTWLAACEKQLAQYPDWQARLSTPAWLLRQQIIVVPEILKRSENQFPGIGEIGGLNIELTRLIDQIHNVQQLITHLETGTSKNFVKDSTEGFTKQIPSVNVSNATLPATGLSDPLGRPDLARTLERELQLHNKGQNTKSSSSKDREDKSEPEMISLKEAYLSFNRWCDQFEEVHLDLQEFVNGNLRVLSSHKISFQQFSHRILKNAKEIEELERVLESFTRLRSGGVDINLEEKSNPVENSENDKNS